MARFTKIALVAIVVVACQSPAPDPPAFNNCWTLFPPGPRFDEQIATYAKTTDPNVVELGCLPTYKLDQEACEKFKQVGPGAWPAEVMSWCESQYGVQLDNLRPSVP